MRSGTLATHQIVGMGEAARILRENMVAENARIAALRNRLWSHLQQTRRRPRQRRSRSGACPATLNVAFAGVDGETLMLALDDLAVSSGSACTSATVEPSYVLRALGLPDDLAHASLRFTVGRFTTEDDIDRAGRRVVEVVEQLRERSAA